MALLEGSLARLVVDGEEGGEGRQGEDLGHNLQDVDERSSGGEVVQEPLRPGRDHRTHVRQGPALTLRSPSRRRVKPTLPKGGLGEEGESACLVASLFKRQGVSIQRLDDVRRELHGVEVVDVVAARDEQHGPKEHLRASAARLKLPNQSRGAEAHGVVDQSVCQSRSLSGPGLGQASGDRRSAYRGRRRLRRGPLPSCSAPLRDGTATVFTAQKVGALEGPMMQKSLGVCSPGRE